MADYPVAEAGELADGDRLVVQLEGREIGVFRVGDDYYAYTNWCLHQAGPVCEGTVTGTHEATFDPDDLETHLEWVRDGEVLCCPWHGWEYDVTTGDCLSRRDRRLVGYPVREEGGEIVVSL